MEDDLCDVVLISGFLGSGKTTLMKNILSWPGDLTGTAVLVNEIGAVGIDGELLQGFEAPVVELPNGCICCSLQADFNKSLRNILDRFGPKRMLIEATGIADPYTILDVLAKPQFQKEFARAKTVTVLDADFWEAREIFGPLFYNQITSADLVLLNKVDLQPAENVPRFLMEIRETSPSGSVVPTYHCQIDPEALWGLRKSTEQGMGPFFADHHGDHEADHDDHEDHHEHDHEHTLSYVTFSFEAEAPFREECFRRFIASVPIKLYRIKGYALFETGRFLVNHVGGKTEWTDLEKKEPTKLAFVGWQVDEQQIMAELRACLDRS